MSATVDREPVTPVSTGEVPFDGSPVTTHLTADNTATVVVTQPTGPVVTTVPWLVGTTTAAKDTDGEAEPPATTVETKPAREVTTKPAPAVETKPAKK